MTRYAVELLLHWVSVGLYVAAFAALAVGVVFGKARAVPWALWLGAAGLVPQAAALVLRWIAVGHGPYMLRYEVLSSDAWVAIAVFLAVAARRRAWASLGLVVLPLAMLAIGIGLFSNPETRDVPPTLRSVWLVFHIAGAQAAAAGFLVSLASAVLLLAKARPAAPAWMRRVPETATLDALTVRSVGLGLIFWTVSIAFGAVWANESWGRYWGWDPIETWSLVSWIAYGAFLHARLFLKLGPRATAWASFGAFAIFILALLILPFLITSMHSAYFS